MKVSVIIPNYCHARYLDERIQSVLGQTYQDFEVIILDDCSPDDGASREVIERYRDNPHVSRIEYNERNSGSTFRQWHKGFEFARGELVWIAESDDTCEPEFLETLVEGFKKYPDTVLAYCTSSVIDENGNPSENGITVGKVAHEYYSGREFIGRELSWRGTIPNASAAIFRREAALGLDKEYMNYVAAGDRLFWIEISECGGVYHSPKVLSHFRHHGGNVTPRYFRDGTTMREDYRINEYLHRKHLVNLMQRLSSSCHFQRIARSAAFDSEETRAAVIKLWTGRGLFYYPILTRFLSFYAKLRGMIKG